MINYFFINKKSCPLRTDGEEIYEYAKHLDVNSIIRPRDSKEQHQNLYTIPDPGHENLHSTCHK